MTSKPWMASFDVIWPDLSHKPPPAASCVLCKECPNLSQRLRTPTTPSAHLQPITPMISCSEIGTLGSWKCWDARGGSWTARQQLVWVVYPLVIHLYSCSTFCKSRIWHKRKPFCSQSSAWCKYEDVSNSIANSEVMRACANLCYFSSEATLQTHQIHLFVLDLLLYGWHTSPTINRICKYMNINKYEHQWNA